MTVATKGFQGDISWVAEATYGDGVVTGSTLLLVANCIQSVKLGHNKALNESRCISTYDVNKIVTGTNMYSLTTEYMVDRNYSTSTLLYTALTRTSGVLGSVAFQVGVGTAQLTSTYYNMKGCKAKNVAISTDEDAPIMVTIDWSVKDVATSTALVVACTDTITTATRKFTGGAFKRGTSATWGYIVGAVSVTIDNGLYEAKDIGNTTLIAAEAGPRALSGTANVCLTDGGATYWAESFTNATSSIEFDFGTTSNDPSIRFASAVIGSIEIPLDSDSAIVMTTIPFTGATASATTEGVIYEAAA